MVIPISLISQFVAVLTATLIGVYTAFLLDRWQQEQQTRQRAIEHLKSLKTEIELNATRVTGNNTLIDHLQQRDREGDHYILEPLETDAWLAALEEPILGTVSNEVYEQLQETYSTSKRVNALIERQRDEMHHSTLGDTEDTGGFSYTIWTIGVDYYDHDKEEVEYTGLGPLIKDEARTLRRNEELLEAIENDIDRLDEYSLRQHIAETLRD